MLLQILTLLGSLAMFLYGMSLMSGGLQKMAGNRMRVFMAKMTSNNFKCILTGIVVTAMVQSSTATTLLIVSFVNAGLLALGSAIAVIMGANIGTTVTAWIFALSFGGAGWSIATIAIPLMFFAFIAMSIKKYANLGEFLMGFALLFLGIATLKETSTVLLDNEGVRTFLSTLSGYGIWSIFLFMLAGAVITFMLQSSATATAITMVLVAQGYIPFAMATAMVLGSNLGTTITSNIAVAVANQSAQRTARAHFLFNLFGVILALLCFRPFLKLVGLAVEALGFPNPVKVAFADADPAMQESLVASLPYSVAVLHTVFNVITTLILVWFIPQLVKLVTMMVPNKGEEKEVHRLKYIGIGKILARVWEHNCKFTENMLRQLNHMVDLLDEAYAAMDHNLSTPLVELTDIHNAEAAEDAVNVYRDALRNEHLSNVEKSSYPYETGSFYMDVVNCLEKMGDFIINISQSVFAAKGA